MTGSMMSLQSLLEKSSDANLLREMIGFAAERLMALEVEGLTGAAHGVRSPDRLTHRNGYRDRMWETRAGTIELKIRSCATALSFRAFSSRGGWPRRHSPPSSRKPTSTAFPSARSTIWCRPSA